MSAFRWIEDFLRDVLFAVRTLRRAPGFAVASVLTLALAIGVNTAIFSVLYGTCLAPLPYRDPGRLVDISLRQVNGHRFEAGTSPLNFEDWIARARSFEALGTHQPQLFVNLTGAGAPQEVESWRLSARVLSVLGVPPLLGRWFVPEEDTASGPHAALLSYNLWQSRFGGEPDVVGKRISLNGEAFAIAGVMPRRFEFPPLIGAYKPALWVSLNLHAKTAADRSAHSLDVVGRLKPGVTIRQAQAEMDAIAAQLAKAYPKENGEWPSAKVSLLSDARYVRNFRSTLWLLMAASSLVLLIACANLAGLLLARGAMREHEFSIRRALGISSDRLVRQLFTENAVLAALGCSAGILLAFWSLPVLKSMLEGSPRVDEIGIRPAVLAFAAGISLLTALAFGLLPAFRVVGRRQKSPRQHLRKALVTMEITLGLVLLSSAGLLAESLWRATRVDLGFQPDRILSLRLSLPSHKYDTGRRVEAFRTDLLRRASALPGVEFAATNSAPPLGSLAQHTDFELAGKTQNAFFANVSPDYLRAMGIPLLRGRNFKPADDPGSPPVAIVSQSIAHRFFPGEEILGQRILLKRLSVPEWFTIVGVSGEVRETDPESAPEGVIYALSRQLPEADQGSGPARTIMLVLRTPASPTGLVKGVQAVVAGIDKDQPVADALTLRQLVDRKLAHRRANTSLLVLFAALALSLTAVGVFGLVSYAVSCRTHEIGIRMALGAGRGSILVLILRESLFFCLLGITAGSAASLAASRLYAGLLYGVSPAAPHILVVSAVFVAVAVILATLLAGRRVLRLDPATALRRYS